MAILFVIYVFGFVTEDYAYGRVVFFMVFLLQLELARFFAQRESSADGGGARASWKMWTGVAVAICVLVSTRSGAGESGSRPSQLPGVRRLHVSCVARSDNTT